MGKRHSRKDFALIETSLGVAANEWIKSSPISMTICAHNSHLDYLKRTFSALEHQTLPRDLVDNASAPENVSPHFTTATRNSLGGIGKSVIHQFDHDVWSGSSLLSGGDNDLAACAGDIELGVGLISFD